MARPITISFFPDWLVLHASKGGLDLRASQLNGDEAGWLIQSTRAAPCPIKLYLDNVALSTQDSADIARQLTGSSRQFTGKPH